MEFVKIAKSIDIHASKEAVWQVLIKDEYTREWYASFSPGSKAETDWQEGSKALFTDDTGNGLAAKVAVNKPAEELVIEYTGFVKQGVEDFESDGAKQVKGGKEIYRLSEQNGITQLATECDMNKEMYDMMAAAWDVAILKIKELAETKASHELNYW